jgi:hypothetical protein
MNERMTDMQTKVKLSKACRLFHLLVRYLIQSNKMVLGRLRFVIAS